MMGRRPQINLTEPVELAWRAFDRAACRVTPAVPILFFGDLEAYRDSCVRVVTVGLNPSKEEFPCKDPFQRFPSLKKGNHGKKDLSRYIQAMSDYFWESPYDEWFKRGFEPVLRGLGASYYRDRTDENDKSTALHTDICSPVATNPTWSKLHEDDKEALQAEGVPLWHMLLEKLQPDIVVLSVSKTYRDQIEFKPMEKSKGSTRTFKKKADGTDRVNPYKVLARWYEVGSKCKSLFGFGYSSDNREQQMPFMMAEKPKASEFLLKKYKEYNKKHQGGP